MMKNTTFSLSNSTFFQQFKKYHVFFFKAYIFLPIGNVHGKKVNSTFYTVDLTV